MKKFKITLLSIFICLILWCIASITYNSLEPKAYDFMIKNVLNEKLPFDKYKNVYGHDDVVLVVIDHDSLQQYRWPWKRELNCKIIDYFAKYAKPKVLIHDSILTALDDDNPESDKNYFATLKKMDNLVEGFMYSTLPYKDEKAGRNYDNMFTKKYEIKNVKNSSIIPPIDYIFPSILTSPKEFLDSVTNMGTIASIPTFINGKQVDETYRTYNYFTKYKNTVLPSLAMSGFLYINNYPEVIINKDNIYFPTLDLKIKHKISKHIPISVVPVRFYKMQGLYTHKYYSAVDIMNSYDSLKKNKEPVINPEIFKDKIVILGVNDPLKDGLNDNKSTPMAVVHPMLDYQATCIDNLVHKDFLTVLPNWVNILLIVLSMFFVYYAIQIHHLVKAISYSFITILVIFGIATCCFYYGYVVNVITPIIMCVAIMVVGYIRKYVVEAWKKQKFQYAMSRYMSEDVMQSVMKNIDNLGLGGKKASVTVLFSDIRGFTSMSEQMSAQQVSQLLNEYFSEMEPIVSKYNGIINKFIGDAIMAVFGEPIQDENHPLNAVKCGYEMLKKVEELDEKWKNEGKPVINIGVGINTGEVFIGNIGSERRMEYTVIGDTVNLASRLEGYNKTYKTHILISTSTYEASKEHVEVNQISDVEIRGKAHKMNIYEVKNIIE